MRIGINIPNELVKRLEPLKPELNISQVCRDALQAKAAKYESAVGNLNGDSTNAALEEVWAEEIRRRSLIDVDWEALGYEDAVAWVAAASWEDWKEWQSLQSLLERQNRARWDIQPIRMSLKGKRVKRFDDRRSDFHHLLMAQSDEVLDWIYDNELEMDWDAAKREYGRAWIGYVKAAWQQICHQRDEYFQLLNKERLENRRNRPAPKVPEHLLADISQGR